MQSVPLDASHTSPTFPDLETHCLSSPLPDFPTQSSFLDRVVDDIWGSQQPKNTRVSQPNANDDIAPSDNLSGNHEDHFQIPTEFPDADQSRHDQIHGFTGVNSSIKPTASSHGEPKQQIVRSPLLRQQALLPGIPKKQFKKASIMSYPPPVAYLQCGITRSC